MDSRGSANICGMHERTTVIVFPLRKILRSSWWSRGVGIL